MQSSDAAGTRGVLAAARFSRRMHLLRRLSRSGLLAPVSCRIAAALGTGASRSAAGSAVPGPSRRRGAGDTLVQLATEFSRGAVEERENGFNNKAGKRFRDFGVFLASVLSRAGPLLPDDQAAKTLREVAAKAAGYSTLLSPERRDLVVRRPATIYKEPHSPLLGKRCRPAGCGV